MALVVLLLILISSCAPLFQCGDENVIKENFSVSKAPRAYSAKLSLREGVFLIPLELKKSQEGISVRAQGREVKLDSQGFCFGLVCFALPVSVDGLIFASVLNGSEKVSCSHGQTVFRGAEGSFEKIVIFENSRPKTLRLVNENREEHLRVDYLNWVQGRAGAIRVKFAGRDAVMIIESLDVSGSF
ncbi:MAG: hypothetical protein ABDH18_03345 [Aquificaceae bacterium]